MCAQIFLLQLVLMLSLLAIFLFGQIVQSVIIQIDGTFWLDRSPTALCYLFLEVALVLCRSLSDDLI